MGIKIEGFDDVLKSLDNLKNQINPDIQFEWAVKITQVAKEMCNDPDCKRIKLERSKNSQNGLNFQWVFSDNDSIDCVIKAIKNNANNMPPIIRTIFEDRIIKFLNEKKK